jgi:hypothetical protein
VEACFANLFKCVQAFLLSACADDLAVELGRGIDVVVVIVETGRLELLRLPWLQHPERRAGFHAESAHGLHHFRHALEVPLFRAPPCGTHAKPRRPFFTRRSRGREDLIDRHQCFVSHARVVARRLRAVTAILRATARLDGEERRELHAVGFEMLPVDRLRAIDEVVERQTVQGFHRIHGPTVLRRA